MLRLVKSFTSNDTPNVLTDVFDIIVIYFLRFFTEYVKKWFSLGD